jgi:hypothetical protein
LAAIIRTEDLSKDYPMGESIVQALKGGRVPRQALLARIEKLLGPTVIEILIDALATAELCNAVLAAQTIQHDADLLFSRVLLARGAADVFHDLL